MRSTGSVGTIFTGSIDLSLMASTVVKQTSESFKDSRKISSGGIAWRLLELFLQAA
jgi:hypothetical protein